MIEQILPDLYKIEVPLPRSPLKALNSYLIKAKDRFLVIDTGMNREECKKVLSAALKQLNVDLNKTDFFITHLHADHEGLVGYFASSTSKVYFTEIEASMVAFNRTERRWQEVKETFISHGSPEHVVTKALGSHPARLYVSDRPVQYHFTNDGEAINFGDYLFTCIETPGHSPCHMCLYEERRGILFSGDHLLNDITPNIAHWQNLNNSLKHYLASLDKVYKLEVSLVLPGHRRIWKDHRARINELKKHHEARLQEALSAIQKGEKSAYEVAPYIHWDIAVESWEQFPPTQKWFALGETLAHLEYLEGEGLARRNVRNGRITFSRA